MMYRYCPTVILSMLEGGYPGSMNTSVSREPKTPPTPEQGPLLEYPPNIKYAESWLFLYNIKNQTYIFPFNASEYAL